MESLSFLNKISIALRLMNLGKFCIIGLLVSCIYSSVYSQEVTQPEIPLESLLDRQITTASRYFQQAREAPASVTVVTSDEIEHCGATTLAGILQYIRSFFISYDHYSYSLGVRGYSKLGDYNNRILLMVDGHRFNENAYGSAMIGREFVVSPSQIDHIEIVRGPGASIYGNNAMFCVINVVTKSAEVLNGFKTVIDYGGSNAFTAAFNYGSVLSNLYSFTLGMNFCHDNGDDLYFKHFDTPENNNGRAINMDGETSASIYSTFKLGRVTLKGGFSRRNKTIPTAEYSTIFNDPDFTDIDQRGFINVNLSMPINPRVDFNLRGYYDHYYFRGEYPYYTDSLGNKEIDYDFNIANWYGFETQLNLNVTEGYNLVIGAELHHDLIQKYNKGTPNIVDLAYNVPRSFYALYLQNDYQITSDLSVSFGLRADRFSQFGNRVSPRVGLIFQANKDLTTKLLFSSGFRAPTPFELYYKDDMSYQKQSRHLTVERITATEAVVEYSHAGLWFLTASIYHNELNDLIDIWPDRRDGMLRFVNLADHIVNGVEFEVKSSRVFNLKAEVNYTLQLSSQEEKPEIVKKPIAGVNIVRFGFGENPVLSNMPEHFGNFGLTYFYEDYGYIKYNLHFETSRKTRNNTDIDGFTRSDVFLSINLPLKGLKAGLNITNLFNESYSFPASYDNAPLLVIPQESRKFILRLDFSF